MTSTRCAVPISRMRHCSSSWAMISRWSLRPVFWMTGRSAGLFEEDESPSYLTTTALILLSLNTVPIPPRPACFRRATFLRGS